MRISRFGTYLPDSNSDIESVTISEEGSDNNEEDEGGGHLIHDEEEEAYVITTKYGRETGRIHLRSKWRQHACAISYQVLAQVPVTA